MPRSLLAYEPALPPSSLSSFSLRKTNSYEVEDHFERVKHGHSAALSMFYLAFESLDTARSFKVAYRISAANLPAPVEGYLHVRVTKGGGASTSTEPAKPESSGAPVDG